MFLAVELPEEVKREIGRIQKKVLSDGVRIKLVENENLHLTLKFFGEVENEKIDRIVKNLSKIEIKPFTSSLEGLGVFPYRDYIKVIWAGLSNAKGFIILKEKIDEELTSLGMKHEKKFSAHITIGRVRSISDKETFYNKFKSLGKNLKNASFKVSEFVLKKSTLTPNGPIYENVHVFRL